MSPPRYTGTVASWSRHAKFGFIKPEDGGRHLHVALRDVKNKQRLRIGQTVTFSNGQYGRAIEVEVDVDKTDVRQVVS